MIDEYSQHIHDSLIHFMKAKKFQDFFETDLISGNAEWCPFKHGPEINAECYRANPYILDLIEFLEKYEQCNKFFGSNKYYLDEFSKLLKELTYQRDIFSYKDFERKLSNISDAIELLDTDIQASIGLLSCEECIRLDESLVNYSNNCTYSSIIMAISAVELRLHRLVKKFDETLYQKKFENATLGKIVIQFTEKSEYPEIKKIMPKKYLPLVQLLNKYRIFAVHPKKEQISQSIVDSILSLSFTFLTDPDNSVCTPEELRCSAEG